jgi:hypothetical protein
MISRDMGADITSGERVEELQLEAAYKQISAVFWTIERIIAPTAGLICPPEMPALTHTPMAKPIPSHEGVHRVSSTVPVPNSAADDDGKPRCPPGRLTENRICEMHSPTAQPKLIERKS